MIPSMQYGSREGRQCLSAVLNKQLTHDIVRHKKMTAAFIENDAVGCYDRMVNNLLLLQLCQLGLPDTAVMALALTWANATHHIKTKYGVSEATYGHTTEIPLYGPGQGSTLGPFLWLILFTLIVNSLSPSTPVTKLSSVDSSIISSDIGEAFVDDSFLGVTSDYNYDTTKTPQQNSQLFAHSAITGLGTLAQQWERLLFATGGAISLQKSFWYLMTWSWTKSGSAKLATETNVPGNLPLTEGNNLGEPVAVPRVEPTTTYRTLGVRISPSGNTKATASYLRGQSIEFATSIASSNLTRTDAYWAFWQYYGPKVGFSLPVLSLSQAQCYSIQSPAMCAILPKLHLNRNTSRAIIFGPEELGGLSLPELYTTEGIGQLRFLLGHLRLRDKTANLILIDVSYLQLIVGSTTLFFNLPFHQYSHSAEGGWLVSIWQFLHSIKFQLHIRRAYIPVVPRKGDKALMDYFVSKHYKPKLLKILNRCRLYLQVIFVSDISSADGTYIIPSIKHGHRLQERPSTLEWPSQPRPPANAWREWSNALSHLESHNKLHDSLGEWISPTHQQWHHFHELTENVLYLPCDKGWSIHHLAPQRQGYTTRLSSEP